MSVVTDKDGYVIGEKKAKSHEDDLLCPNCLEKGIRNSDGSRSKLWNGEKCRTCGYRAMNPVEWTPANHSDMARKGWVTRRMKYGISGIKNRREPAWKDDVVFDLP